MSDGRIDVLGIGNAIVDVLSHVDDAFLAELGLPKGAMTLVDAGAAAALAARLPSAVRRSGGSAANTVVGVASLGGTSAFIGRVRDDDLGRTFRDDLRAAGVRYELAPAPDGPATGRCVVLVTPDAQRTMQTFLGASAGLGPDDVDAALVSSARIVYLEGYLWDPPAAKQAFLRAADLAHAAGRLVALSLSDRFCVERHRAEFRRLAADHVDVLLANEDEVLSLFEAADLDRALGRVAGRSRIVAVTRGAAGAIVRTDGETLRVAAEPVARVVDTTGAGDLFAAGFLLGLASGRDPESSARLGSIAAAEVIGHFGARPETRLADLVAARGGSRR